MNVAANPRPTVSRRDVALAALGLGFAPVVAAADRTEPCSSVVELRQYTLRGGQRDGVIAMFQRDLAAPMEAAGVRIIGQFRDLDDADRFVWLRGFESMPERVRSLAKFYSGDAWRTARATASATVLEADNVLLLRPSAPIREFELPTDRRGGPAGLITASIRYLTPELVVSYSDFFETSLRPRIEAAGARVVGAFVTEGGPNTFPALPIRSADHVHVWFGRFEDQGAQRASAARVESQSGWRDAAPASLLPAFMRKTEVLRLAPTAQSRLR